MATTKEQTAPAAKLYSALGRHERKGLTLVDLIRMFPDDQTAEAWIARIRWPDGADVAGVRAGPLQDRSAAGAMVYSDDHRAYWGLPNHEAVKHSVAEYVNGQAHVNGIESFWAGLKRAYHGTFHHVRAEHLDRYVCEAAGRHNRRGLDTLAMMERVVAGMVGRHLPYAELIAGGPAARKRAAELAGIPPVHPF